MNKTQTAEPNWKGSKKKYQIMTIGGIHVSTQLVLVDHFS
jgi:hypothetical protein